MLIINGHIAICLTLALIYFVGFLKFLTDYEENKCEMTYMFQFPQFVQIVTPYDYEFKKYGLYAYNEGHFTEKTRNMYFDGIPVLFIPGNAGSYKQVRSFASVALRKALNSKYGFHFDYFTLDLNGEFSGFNGMLLEEQSDYVNRSIYHILSLYKNRWNPPSSLVIIGHSMGGVLAQHISNVNKKDLVPVIITLSSPIYRPSIMFDYPMHRFYKNAIFNSNDTFSVHLSGGFNDFLVPTYLAKGHGINVVTTSIPKVWLPTDHLCILWCKQLVLAVNRALFEAVDSKSKLITKDITHLKKVFQYHLIKNPGTKMNWSLHDSPTDINNAGEWIEKLPRQYTVRLLEGTREQQWHMIPYRDLPKHDHLSIVAINLELADWIFACSASYVRGHSRICAQAKHLSHLSEIAPSARYKRRTFNINMHALKERYPNWTHIVAKIPPTKEPIILHVDTHSKQDRTVTVNLPHFWELTKKNVIRETADKAITYELKFPALNHIIQSYRLHVEAFKCQYPTHHATASLLVPWNNENIHKYFTEAESSPLNVRLYSSKLSKFTNATASVRLTLDPTCKYHISIQTNWMENLGQLARYYLPLLLANVVAVILMTLRKQLNSINTEEKCPLFFVAMKEGAKPYYIVTYAKLITKMFGIKYTAKFLPVTDWAILSNEGTDFLLLPLLLYLTSVGLVWIISIALSVIMVAFEASANKIVMKFVSMSITTPFGWSEWILNGLQKLPGIVAGLLIIISFSTCGGLALAIGTIFYFFKLTKMSQDFIEDAIWKAAKILLAKIRKIFKRKKSNKNNEILIITNKDSQESDAKENENNHNIENSILNDGTSSEDSVKDSAENQSSMQENSLNTSEKGAENPTTSNINTSESSESTSQKLTELLENDEIFFHFTIFLLWSLVTLINIPVVLAWAHNYKYSKVLKQDPSFFPGIILSMCSLALWQFEFPKLGRRGYKQLGNLTFIVALLALIYCPISIYRLNYLLTCLIAVIVLHQLIVTNKENYEEKSQGNGDEINISSIFEKIKAKWE